MTWGRRNRAGQRADLISRNGPKYIQLFALMVREYQEACRQGRQMRIKPGHFVLLSLKAPNFDELRRLGDGARRRWKTSPSLNSLERHWPDDAAGPALKLGLARAGEFGVASGTELCRMMIAVLQTVQPIHNRSLQSRYQALVQSGLGDISTPGKGRKLESPHIIYRPRWWEDALRVQGRPDETGQSVALDGIRLWHASHLGTPQKTLNQDATFARLAGNQLCFALADGVTTSLGSREAAAVAAAAFCDYVAVKAEPAPFAAALAAARDALCQLRDEMEQEVNSNFRNGRFPHVFAGIQRDLAQHLFEESRKGTPKRPVLATTLIAGTVCPNGHGAAVELVRLGDGVVEKAGSSSVDSLLSMDAEITRIANYLGPDTKSKEFIPDATSTYLKSNEWLLVSSDGLVRGPQSTVWSAIEEILQKTPDEWMVDGAPDSAWQLLNSLYKRVRSEPQFSSLFQDNWSLVLAQARGGKQ